MPVNQIQYSERYSDDIYEYSFICGFKDVPVGMRYFPAVKCGLLSKHVILPAAIARLVPKSHLMSETEWRNLGVRQSPDWMHFMIHNPEPHVLLFRRPRTDVPQSGTSGVEGQTSSVDH